MRIDLHTHSTASDGTDAPARVVADAAAAGLDVVALTDHDTTAGWADAAESARRHGIALVRGAEISARSGHVSVHLLSYLHDPTHPDLLAETERTREDRVSRARRMVERIGEDYPLTWEDVLSQTEEGTTIGRPHIADALVATGHVSDRSAAFATILHPGTGYYVPHYAPTSWTPCARCARRAACPSSPTRAPTDEDAWCRTWSSSRWPTQDCWGSRCTTATTAHSRLPASRTSPTPWVSS